MADNKHCAYCRAIIFDDDDVVYCPDCGAMHHRDCWNEIGHCALQDKHGTFTEEEKSAVNINVPCCPKCGKAHAEDAVYCQYCGCSLNEPEPTPIYYTTNPFVTSPYGGLNPTDKIEGISVTTMASYVRNNSQKYIPDFKKLEKKEKKSKKVIWNWASFLFGYIWLFYRKCHKPAWVVFAINTVATILRTPLLVMFMQIVYSIIGTPTSTTTTIYNEIMINSNEIMAELISKVSLPVVIMFFVSIALEIGIHIFLGMFGEYIFKNNAVSKIKSIEEADIIDNKHELIARSGGVNIFMPFIAIYLGNIISTLIMTII